jgi:hypothetical protein
MYGFLLESGEEGDENEKLFAQWEFYDELVFMIYLKICGVDGGLLSCCPLKPIKN